MFSSKDLISFVFANENDTYYGDDLLKRDLNQYLWERLHGNYEAVYFLSAEGNSFRVRSFGDLSCHDYGTGKKKMFGLFAGQRALGDWIVRQLRAKSDATAAFVCPLDDFCSVLSDPRWDPVLEAIAEEKKRTGIFVLTASATAEKSADLLLTSPVFEKLHESTITDLRDGAPRELYSTLKKRKWDNCVFMNTFTWERVHGLLLHLVMEHSDRCQSCERLDMMTEYLYTYLRAPEGGMEPLLPEKPVAGYLMYEELHTWLKNERNWKKFNNQVDCFEKNNKNWTHPEWAPANVAVLRDPNSYAGRCMKIKLPQWLSSDTEAEEQAQAILQGICSEVMAPKNKVENKEIVAIAGDLLNRLDGVARTDADSYNWILSTLQFCVGQIYAPPEEEKTARIMTVLQKKMDAIGIFTQYFALRNNLKLIQISSTDGKLESVTMQKLKTELYVLEQIKKRYVDLISAMELELKMPAKTDHFSSFLEELKTEIGNFEQKLESIPEADQTPAPETEADQTPAAETEGEEMEFVLTSDLYNFIPPTY